MRAVVDPNVLPTASRTSIPQNSGLAVPADILGSFAKMPHFAGVFPDVSVDRGVRD